MAVNKNAQTRYHVLDKCFSNTVKKYFIEDLIQSCSNALLEITPDSKGISRRQIFEDIKYMESEEGFKAPISKLKDGKQTFYRYADKDFSIDKQPLNQAELEQVKSAMNILSRFEGMPQFAWVNELTPKLEQSFMIEKDVAPIIGFDNNAYLEGIQHLGKLYHYILYQQPLCITYQSFKNDQPTKFIIHPYYLKQYNNRWFLFGLNNKYNTISNLALDRIKDIDEEKILFIINNLYDDFKEYFDDIIGVSLPQQGIKEKIILQFSPSSAPYVISKPLHHSQKKISYDNGVLIISIEVIPNYELESLILSFGERVEVLEPLIFKNSIAERLKLNMDIYE